MTTESLPTDALGACPFCGTHNDSSDPGVLHPTGSAWVDDATSGIRHYVRAVGVDPKTWCYQVNCLKCGATVSGDSASEAIAAWNRRAQPVSTTRDTRSVGAIIARVVLGADGKPASEIHLVAKGDGLDTELFDATYPHRAPHRIANLVEYPTAQPAADTVADLSCIPTEEVLEASTLVLAKMIKSGELQFAEAANVSPASIAFRRALDRPLHELMRAASTGPRAKFQQTGMPSTQHSVVRVCPECDIAGCRHLRAPVVVAEPVETIKFSDNSTASPLDKARRYLDTMADHRLSKKYFFSDGFPRQVIASDAQATLAIFDQLVGDLKNALNDAQELRQQMRLLEEHIGDSVWRWQADGGDHLESMGARMGVLIYASDLRKLIAEANGTSTESHNFAICQHFDSWLLERGTYILRHTEEVDGPLAPALNWIASVEAMLANNTA